MRDKDAATAERVAWTETLNLRTADPEKALKVMAWTALHQEDLKRAAGVPLSGRKTEDFTFHFSLAWHPEQEPDKAEMMEAAKQALKALGMSRYQTVVSCHTDEPQPHIHVLVNRVHPETGRAVNIRKAYLTLSRWAENHEREHGKIYCEERVANNAKRDRGEFVKHRDPVINKAWQRSDNGRSFAAALAGGNYILARGDRRDFVVVDAHGKTINPSRQIEGAKAKDIKAKLSDLDPASLPDVSEARRLQAVRKRGEDDRDRDMKQDEEKAAARRRAEQKRTAEKRHKRAEARQNGRERQAEFIREKRAQAGRQPEIWDRESYEIERDKAVVDAAIAQEIERERAAKRQRRQGPAAPAMPRQHRPELWREFNEARQLSPEQFDEFRNRKRAALQSTQIDEMQTRKTQAERAVEQAGETARAGRPELQRDREKLADIAWRQSRGGLYWLVYHLSGKARDDRGQIEPLQNNIRSAEERIEEDIGRVRTREEADIAVLDLRHRQQQRELENNLEQARRRNPHVQQQEREREERQQAIADEIRRNMERQRHRDRSRGMER